MGSFCTRLQANTCFVIGPRKQYVADKLIELVNKHISDKIPVFVTDGLNFYREALLKQFGVLREFPRTGKRGRPKKPKIVPSEDLRYAQVVKTRVNGVLEKVEKKIIFGENIEQSEICILFKFDGFSITGKI